MNSEKDALTSLSLLERAKIGDNESWNDIMLLYTPLIYFWCRRADIDVHDAEEIWATVLRKAFEKLPTFTHNGHPGAFRTWLRTITIRSILDSKSGEKTLPLQTGNLVDNGSRPDELVSSGPSEEEIVLYQRAWQLIRDEFSERDQIVFRRIAENGEAPKDVAEDLELKRSVVYTLVNRIKTRLQTRFQGEIER